MRNAPRLPAALLLFCILFFSGNTSAEVSLETVAYGGSLYFRAENNGSIEPVTWLNASAATLQMANGDNGAEALERAKWLKFDYGLGRMVAGVPTFYSPDAIENMNSYGYSDNATYWRTEANATRSILDRQITLRVLHSQQALDDYVLQEWVLDSSAPVTAPTDVYFIAKLREINIENDGDTDNLNYGYDNGSFYTTPLNLSQAHLLRNVSAFSITDFQTTRGWRWQLHPQENSLETILLFVPNASASNGVLYYGYKLGRTINNFQIFLHQIDATCSFVCGGGDAGHVETTTVNTNGGTQVGYGIYNKTFSSRWYDDLGTCSLSGTSCHLTLQARDPLISTLYKTVTGLGGNNWVSCNMLVTSPDPARGGCTADALPIAYIGTPAKGVYYYWNISGIGRQPAPFLHYVRTDIGGLASSIQLFGVTDATAPNLTQFNPANLSTVASSTLAFSFASNDTGIIRSWDYNENVTGSLVSHNFTTAFTNITFILSDSVSGLQNGGYYRFCFRVKDTFSNTNSTECYDWKANNIPASGMAEDPLSCNFPTLIYNQSFPVSCISNNATGAQLTGQKISCQAYWANNISIAPLSVQAASDAFEATNGTYLWMFNPPLKERCYYVNCSSAFAVTANAPAAPAGTICTMWNYVDVANVTSTNDTLHLRMAQNQTYFTVYIRDMNGTIQAQMASNNSGIIVSVSAANGTILASNALNTSGVLDAMSQENTTILAHMLGNTSGILSALSSMNSSFLGNLSSNFSGMISSVSFANGTILAALADNTSELFVALVFANNTLLASMGLNASVNDIAKAIVAIAYANETILDNMRGNFTAVNAGILGNFSMLNNSVWLGFNYTLGNLSGINDTLFIMNASLFDNSTGSLLAKINDSTYNLSLMWNYWKCAPKEARNEAGAQNAVCYFLREIMDKPAGAAMLYFYDDGSGKVAVKVETTDGIKQLPLGGLNLKIDSPLMKIVAILVILVISVLLLIWVYGRYVRPQQDYRRVWYLWVLIALGFVIALLLLGIVFYL